MRLRLAFALVFVAACGSSAAKPKDPNVVAVGKPAGSASGVSALPPCDATRGAVLDVEHAEGIRIIERCITGASADTKAALEKVLTLRADKVLSADALRRDLEAAYATALVDQIEATARQSGSGANLFLAVVERPRISALTFDGVGAVKDDPSLAAFPKVGAPLDLAKVHAASEKLRSAFASRGFEEAKVSRVVEPDGAGKARVKIAVVEGTRAKIGKVTFPGAREGRDVGLRKVVDLPEGSPLDPDKVAQAGLLATAFYYDRGFVNVRIAEPARTRAPDGTTSIVFFVTEGPVFRVGKLAVKAEDPATEKAVLAALKVKSGEVFSRAKLKADIDDLQARSQRSGKPLWAEPDTSLDPKARTIDITLVVRGSP